MSSTIKIGFVGIGKMGYPMAACLLRRGNEVVVLDKDRSAAEAFVAENGGRVADGLAALAEASDAIITMLPNGKVVRAVTFGEGDNLVAGLRAGHAFIDMSSSAPSDTETLHARLADLGISAVDAPVSGGVRRALDGTLTIMAGGDAEAVDRARPILECMGKVVHAGKPGAGQAAKALNNLLSAAGFLVGVETMLVARRFGLDLDTFVSILNGSTGKNNSTENKFVQYVLSRSFNSGFALDLMVKDLDTALELARQTDTVTFLSPLCREIWTSALKELPEGADHTEVARWLEARTATELTGEQD